MLIKNHKNNNIKSKNFTSIYACKYFCCSLLSKYIFALKNLVYFTEMHKKDDLPDFFQEDFAMN